MADIAANIPLPESSVLDGDSFTHSWWYFLQRVWARTGQASGADFGPVAPITVGASPFIYTAPANGFVLISGGGISKMRYRNHGTAWFATGGFYGAFPILSMSQLEVTYVRKPHMTLIPS